MVALEPIEWLAVTGVAGAAAIGLLHIVAVRIRNDREIGELFRIAMDIRRRHEARMDALRGGVHLDDEAFDVVIVDEDDDIPGEAPIAPEPARRAA
ncbi:MAG: hypothetical protein ACF8QF_06245 [Phycisphaerales bacterium]